MISLREAREKGKLDQFIKEQEKQTDEGDAEALNRGIEAMAGKSSEAPKASRKRPRGG